MSQYHFAYYTREDISLAEQKSREIIGHDNMVSLLEQMDRMELKEIPWFKLCESDRDIINGYCAIPVRYYPEIKIRMITDYDPKKAGYPFSISPLCTLKKGGIYYAKSNPLGAISALSQSGDFIGVKPEEFQFISAPDWVLEKHGICPVCFKKGVR